MKSQAKTSAELARANALANLLERKGSITYDASFFKVRAKLAGWSAAMCWQAADILETQGRAQFDADRSNVVLRPTPDGEVTR